MKTIYLLDGYSLIYRSYFAFIRTPLISKNGKNISAEFGFFRTMISFYNQFKPSHFGVVLDPKGPTFRHEMYPEYKANREKAPEDLHAQVPFIEEALRLMKIPVLRRDGFEADDLLATMASLCVKSGEYNLGIITGDKDLLQLVDKDVFVLRPDKGSYLKIDPKAVQEERGVRPDQIIDLLALMGDSSDNVPGVPGVGPKTAVNLLTQFDTLDKIYENLDQVSSVSVRTKLTDNKELAFLSKTLVALKHDVPLEFDPQSLAYNPGDLTFAYDAFVAEGLNSLASEIRASGPAPVKSAKKQNDLFEKEELNPPVQVSGGDYSAILDEKDLYLWADLIRTKKMVCLDTETEGLDVLNDALDGISICVESGKAAYIPIQCKGTECLSWDTIKKILGPVLCSPDTKIIGQNIKFDYQVLKANGLVLNQPGFDTMIAAWLCDTSLGQYGLDFLSSHYLDHQMIAFDKTVPKGDVFSSVPLKEATEYSAEDADFTFRLYEYFKDKPEIISGLFATTEMPLVTVLSEMEDNGIRLDREALAQYSIELGRDLDRIEKEIYALCGKEFNINSPKQLQEILFVDRKLPSAKKTKTGFSTDVSVLEELKDLDPVPAKILDHRTLGKLKSTYVDALPEMVNKKTGKIHTHFVQTGTATGRLSSKDPNLQNIPIRQKEGRRIRDAFLPDEGNLLISADYSQIELVVLAHLSQDKNLCSAFREGKDVHRQTASLLFDVMEPLVSDQQRQMAKTINFGVIYGMSAFRLAREMKISQTMGKKFIESYFERFSGINAFIQSVIAEAEKTGFVQTMLGRKRPVLGISSRNKTEKQAAERIALNTTIQGSAADIVKTAMLRISKEVLPRNPDLKLLLQVHDELIFETPVSHASEACNLIKASMEASAQLSVPLRVQVETGKRWGDMH